MRYTSFLALDLMCALLLALFCQMLSAACHALRSIRCIIRQQHHTSAASYVSICQHMSAYVSIRQHMSAYVSIRQHTSAYVSIRQHADVSADLSIADKFFQP